MMYGTAEVIDESLNEPEESAQRSGNSRRRRLNQIDADPGLIAGFRRACEQKTASIVRVSSSESGIGPQRVLWDRPSLIVGKGADCDLRLPHAEISRQHAYFQLIGERIYCADLGSRTGTHWSNGATQAGWVDFEEPVSIGPYSLTFEPSSRSLQMDGFDQDDFDDQVSREAEGCDISDQTEMYLDFVNAGRKVRRYRVTRDVTLIGSGDGVKIHLTHPSVSNAHCSVVRTPTGLWVVDLLSADGTLVNGQVEPLAPLRPGEEFQIGRFLVAVHYGEAEEVGESPLRIRSDHDQSLQGTTDEMDREPVSSELSNSVLSSADDEEPGRLSSLNQLARLTASRQNTNGVPAPIEGLSEQFVLNIIRELGVLQQQALQHAQESMKETVSQLSSTYQQRIDALESQHFVLRDQLHLLTSERAADQFAQRRLPSPAESEDSPADGSAFDSPDVDEQDHPMDDPFSNADQDVFDEIDPEHKEEWIREQIKTVEAQLDKTHRGWGKKLVDLLGY